MWLSLFLGVSGTAAVSGVEVGGGISHPHSSSSSSSSSYAPSVKNDNILPVWDGGLLGLFLQSDDNDYRHHQRRRADEEDDTFVILRN